MNVAELLERETRYRATEIEQVRTAAKHNVWRCDDQFFVKIGTRDNFPIEAKALELAASVGIPVPEVVATGEGFLISRAVSGVPVADESLGIELRRKALGQAGHHLRALHGITAPGFGRPAGDTFRGRRVTWIEHIEEQLDWSVPLLRDVVDVDVVLREFERLRVRIADVAQGSVLHGDFSFWHALVDPGSGNVTALIDWADAQVGDPLWDTIVFGSWEPRLIGPLLAGYEPDEAFRERLDALFDFYRAFRHMWGYRAGLEDGWDESLRLPILRSLTAEFAHRD